MLTLPIAEHEDPGSHLARIRSTHAQINSGGKDLSDKMLVYAMTIALPDLFDTIKRSLWLSLILTLAQVIGAIKIRMD